MITMSQKLDKKYSLQTDVTTVWRQFCSLMHCVKHYELMQFFRKYTSYDLLNIKNISYDSRSFPFEQLLKSD